MSQEYENSEEVASDTGANTQTTPQNTSSTGRTYSEEEFNAVMKDRLAKKDMESKRRMEEQREFLEKRIRELESKEKKGTATTAERIELSAGSTAEAKAHNQGIPPEQIPYIVEDEMTKRKYAQKVLEGTKTDPELQAAINDRNARVLVNPDQQYFLKDSPNAVAMLKCLLIDRPENNMMQAKWQEMIHRGEPSIFVEYMNNLSKKLLKSENSPRAPSYTPDANLSDFGDSSQNFELSEYVKNHR